MATIDDLTQGKVLDNNMQIPVSLFGQNLRISLGQILEMQSKIPQVKIQYSTDGNSWHDNFESTDLWLRISQDGGQTWGDRIRINATDGQPGATLYTWIKYSDIANPSKASDIYDVPTDNTQYIGLAFNKPTKEKSDDPNDYQWSRLRGKDGVSLTDVGEYYAAGESATTPPALGLFVQVPPNKMPAMSKSKPYLWNYEKTYFSDGRESTTDPVMIGSLGADGVGISQVINYYLASSRIEGVTKEDFEDEKWTTNEEEASKAFGESKPYLWNYEEIIYTNLVKETTDPHLIGRALTDEEKLAIQNRVTTETQSKVQRELTPLISVSPSSLVLADNTTYSLDVKSNLVFKKITNILVSLPVGYAWLSVANVTASGTTEASVSIKAGTIPDGALPERIGLTVFCDDGTQTIVSVPFSVETKIKVDEENRLVVNGKIASQSLTGKDGEPGATWKPTVDKDGVLSWNRDGSTKEPESVNIKGENGGTWRPSVNPETGLLSWELNPSTSVPSSVNVKGAPGTPGAPGTTFTPSVSADGTLSWSNNGGLSNPGSVNIKGKDGQTFRPSMDADGNITFKASTDLSDAKVDLATKFATVASVTAVNNRFANYWTKDEVGSQIDTNIANRNFITRNDLVTEVNSNINNRNLATKKEVEDGLAKKIEISDNNLGIYSLQFSRGNNGQLELFACTEDLHCEKICSPVTTEMADTFVQKMGDEMTGDLVVPKIYLSAASSTAYLSADNSHNCFVNVDGWYMLVCNAQDLSIRTGASHDGRISLGKESVRWSNVYANTINVSSTNLVSNLNADMLDGYHASSFLTKTDGATNYVTALSTLGNQLLWHKNGLSNTLTIPYATNADTVDGYHAANLQTGVRFSLAAGYTIKIPITNTTSSIVSMRGTLSTSGAVLVITGYGTTSLRTQPYWLINRDPARIIAYVNGDSETGAVYIQNTTTGTLDCSIFDSLRSTSYEIVNTVPTDATMVTNVMAVTTDNVASATKLQTARTLWGQSFDGSGNVSGNINVGGNITNVAESINFVRTSWNYITVPTGANLSLNIGAAGTANTKLCITESGSVGVATSAPNSAYKLHVVGEAFATHFNTSSTNLVTNLNADLLDGVHYQNILERAYSTRITQDVSGTDGHWYRVGQFISYNNYSPSAIIMVGRSYHSPKNEGYVFSVTLGYNGEISITQLSGVPGAPLIDSVRVDYKNSAICYFDIHVKYHSGNYANDLDITAIGAFRTYSKSEVIVDPSISGSTYEFTTDSGLKSNKITSTGEIISTNINQFRAVQQHYGFFIRNQDDKTFFMLTNSGDPYGNHNDLRPMVISNNSGDVYIGSQTLTVIHGGNVGVGTPTPTHKFHVNGLAYATTGFETNGTFVKTGGTSNQFLKADGSIDSNVYLTASSLTNYVTTNTDQAITGVKTFSRNIIFRDTAPNTSGWSGNAGNGMIFYRGTESDASTDMKFGVYSGSRNQDGILTDRYFYLGWGSTPYNPTMNLSVCDSYFRYKDKDVLHTGNYTSVLDNRFVKKTGDTMTGNLSIDFGAGASAAKVTVSNTYGSVLLQAAGSRGLYDNTVGRWIIAAFQNGSHTILRGGNVNINTDSDLGYALGVSGSIYSSSSITAAGYLRSNIATGNAPLIVSSTTLVSNLNADMLDGLHGSSFLQLKPMRCNQDSIYDLRWNFGVYNRNDYSSGTYYSEYPSPYGVYLSLTERDKNSAALIFIDSGNGGDAHIHVNTRKAGDPNTKFDGWKKVAYMTDNVASATQLQTTRTLWGQEFNGTQNVSGNMTGVGSITASGSLYLGTSTFYSSLPSGVPLLVQADSTSNNAAKTLAIFRHGITTSSASQYGARLEMLAQDGGITLQTYNGSSAAAGLRLNQNGGPVIIGNGPINSVDTLYVAGNIYSTSTGEFDGEVEAASFSSLGGITAKGTVTAQRFQLTNNNNCFLTYTSSYTEISTNANEIIIAGTDAANFYVNYRAGHSGVLPALWHWRAGGSTWANFALGSITAYGYISATGNISNTGNITSSGAISGNTIKATTSIESSALIVTDSSFSLMGASNNLYFTHESENVLMLSYKSQSLAPVAAWNGLFDLGREDNRWGCVYTKTINMSESLTTPKFQLTGHAACYLETVGRTTKLSTYGGDLLIKGTQSYMQVNGDAADSTNLTPAAWFWHAGSQDTYAGFVIGALVANGTLSVTGKSTLSSDLSVSGKTDIGGNLGLAGRFGIGGVTLGTSYTDPWMDVCSIGNSYTETAIARFQWRMSSVTSTEGVQLLVNMTLGSGAMLKLQTKNCAASPTATRMLLNPEGGGVSVGTTATAYTFQVYGTIGASGSITQNTSSDLRLKEDIRSIDCMWKIRKLGSVVSYRYRPEAVAGKDWLDSTTRHIGLIYQNAVNANIPGFANEDENGFGNLNYLTGDLTALVIGGLQETDSEVQMLKAEVQALKRRVTELETQLSIN